MKEINEFITLLKEDNFSKAAEYLELLWREYKNNDYTRMESFILKGLINGSFSLAMYQIGKKNSCELLWKKYEKYQPLINELVSINTHKYKLAAKILEDKRNQLVR